MGVEGDERVMQMLLVVDEASEYVFQGQPVLGGDLERPSGSSVEAFRGGGLGGRQGSAPQDRFSSRKLYEAMAAILEPLGVQCVYEPVIPKLQAIVAEFYDQLDSQSPAA